MVMKSQSEMEQPAKVYQIEAVSTQLTELSGMVQTLVQKSDLQVTSKQLEDSLLAQRTAFTSEIKGVTDTLNARIDAQNAEIKSLKKDNEDIKNKFDKAMQIGASICVVVVATGAVIVFFGR